MGHHRCAGKKEAGREGRGASEQTSPREAAPWGRSVLTTSVYEDGSAMDAVPTMGW